MEMTITAKVQIYPSEEEKNTSSYRYALLH